MPRRKTAMPGCEKQAFFLSMIAALLVPAPVSAQNSSQGAAASSSKASSVLGRIRKKMRKTRTPGNWAKRWFDALDLDKDEEIAKRELFESISRRLETMDRTHDKFVNQSEYLSLRKGRVLGEKSFGALDSNSDGRLSMSEFASPADWRFDRIDRNLDRKVSR